MKILEALLLETQIYKYSFKKSNKNMNKIVSFGVC